MHVGLKLWHALQEGDTEENVEADTEAADASEMGMLTPPQPVPRDNAAEAAPEEEMSFTGLVDDGDEDVHTHGPEEREKTSASAKVLVDQDDVDVSSFIHHTYDMLLEGDADCSMHMPAASVVHARFSLLCLEGPTTAVFISESAAVSIQACWA